MRHLHRVGAVFYLAWALIHVVAGLSLVASALTDVNGHLREIGTTATASELPHLAEATVVSAILGFHSFDMVWIGLMVGVIAARMNWHNSRVGYGLNLALGGFLDVGLIAFLLAPGYMGWADGWVGPLLFLAGAVCSTGGLFFGPTEAA